ncbi:MAG: DUF4276 family protein [Ectothiorhodospiraceae bacterium AqS1]|nr:DUF4276 family protein [Ectothiorhodospiraceae bacterium AqS1]
MDIYMIVSIVEGHGEVASVPDLLHRISQEEYPGLLLKTPPPIRIPKAKMLQKRGIEKGIALAAGIIGKENKGGILVLLDADNDCPVEKADILRKRAIESRPDQDIRIVLAKMEYEAWFLAAAESIFGKERIEEDIRAMKDPESIRDAKGWLKKRMSPGLSYRETIHQKEFTKKFDMEMARKRSPSFEKFRRDIRDLITLAKTR